MTDNRNDPRINNITESEAIDRIWEMVAKIRTCMLVTWDGKEQHSRPMAARPDREAGQIYFLTDVTGRKDDEIERYPTINLSFSDPGSNKYVSLSGRGVVSNDRGKISELWTEFDKAWWESDQDPNIRLLSFNPANGEVWDGANKLVAGVKMITAAITGAKPDLGDNRRVDDV